jgi:hypothetical protein
VRGDFERKQEEANELTKKAREVNQALKAELARLKSQYMEEQESAKDLVPSNIIIGLQSEIEELRSSHTKNSQLVGCITINEKEVGKLKEQYEVLRWQDNSGMKSIEEEIKRAQAEKEELEVSIKETQKEEDRMARALAEYKNQYPDFEAVRQKRIEAAAERERQIKMEKEREMERERVQKEQERKEKEKQQELERQRQLELEK